jgi:hypothetical protein
MPSLDWNTLSLVQMMTIPTLKIDNLFLPHHNIHLIVRDNSPTHTKSPPHHHRHHHSTSAADWPSIFQVIVPGRLPPFPHPRCHPIHHTMTFMAVHQVILATTTPPTNLHNPMNPFAISQFNKKQYTTDHDDNIYAKRTRPLETPT